MNPPIATASDPGQVIIQFLLLSRAETGEGLRLIMEQQVKPVQTGVLLSTLRIKRETDEENPGVLDALRGITTTMTVRLADPAGGWAYLDQSHFAPKRHALIGLRTLIVKHPAITTVENLCGPLRGRHSTHLLDSGQALAHFQHASTDR